MALSVGDNSVCQHWSDARQELQVFAVACIWVNRRINVEHTLWRIRLRDEYSRRGSEGSFALPPIHEPASEEKTQDDDHLLLSARKSGGKPIQISHKQQLLFIDQFLQLGHGQNLNIRLHVLKLLRDHLDFVAAGIP